jgi:triphosphatase
LTVVGGKSEHEAKEIELKLEFDSADAPRILSHPSLAGSDAEPETRELISIYYDTGDDVLRRAGVFLRVRSTGDGYVQTIKTGPQAEFLERDEWEQTVLAHEPDLSAAEGTALAPLLSAEVRGSLQPRFHTRFLRKTYRVRRDTSEIELAIDQGEITAGVKATPISELELELKTGDKRALFLLAGELAETVPLNLAVKTKAERGFELLDSGDHSVEKAGDVVIAPDMTVVEAFRIVGRSCLRQIVANAPAVRRGRPEALHQMRIGLRRLHAGIVLFGDVLAGEELDTITDKLRWIAQELGPARDLDVFAADVIEPLRVAHPDDAELAAAQRDFVARRAAAYARAIGAVSSHRFRKTLLDVAAWIETGAWGARDREQAPSLVADYAARVLSRLRRKVKKRGRKLRDLSADKRHKLRIAAKRLRYATEFFASTFPGKKRANRHEESLTSLRELQDSLGLLNDIATREAMLAAGEEALPQHILMAAPGDEAKWLKESERAYERFAKVKAFWKD